MSTTTTPLKLTAVIKGPDGKEYAAVEFTRDLGGVTVYHEETDETMDLIPFFNEAFDICEREAKTAQ